MPKNSVAGCIYGRFTASKIWRLIRRAVILPADFRRTNFWRRIRRSAAAEGSTDNRTKHHIHPKHKIETALTAIANKTNCTLVWYAIYDLQPGNGASPIFIALKPTRGLWLRLSLKFKSPGNLFNCWTESKHAKENMTFDNVPIQTQTTLGNFDRHSSLS